MYFSKSTLRASSSGSTTTQASPCWTPWLKCYCRGGLTTHGIIVPRTCVSTRHSFKLSKRAEIEAWPSMFVISGPGEPESGLRYPDRPLLPLDHPQRHQPRHLPGEPRLVDHLDDAVDVLVGVGGFLGQFAYRGADDDAAVLQALAHLGSRLHLFRRRAA